MNTEQYTRKTLEAFRAAQTLAQENGNQYLTPEHLFYALLDQKEGLIPSVFARMGADCAAMKQEALALVQLQLLSRQSSQLCSRASAIPRWALSRQLRMFLVWVLRKLRNSLRRHLLPSRRMFPRMRLMTS